MSVFRLIPSIDAVLQRDALRAASVRHGHDTVAAAARRAADLLRQTLGRGGPGLPDSDADAAAWIEAAALTALEAQVAPSLRRVINATGVILHTNLGRAPIADAAVRRASELAAGYTNLEYDLDAGGRGHRAVHAEHLLRALTGAEAAAVVNNNASATTLVLAALARGREVLVSRGEMVEIGGAFRVPDVMAQSGALLREVGTTNRTRPSDYGAAIGERTGLVLRVHPSNFRIEGFTERPALADLAALAHRFDLPLVEDLGSGWLGLADVETPDVLRDEPSVVGSLAAGADLVTFSGDKLLGGPQAGILVGRKAVIDRLRTHPLMRAFRADKITYATLEATLALWAEPARRVEIPVFRMLTMTLAEIDERARALAAQVRTIQGVTVALIDGASTTGGGSAPASTLPTRLVEIDAAGVTAAELMRRLRSTSPPVIARIDRDRVVIDPRTVLDADRDALAGALRAALA